MSGHPVPDRGRAAERADEDAAALAVVIAVLRAPAPAHPEPARSAWAAPAHRLRVPVAGRHGWWMSGLPS